jgi:hypothetical protein
MSCPSDGGRMAETETGRYCVTCGYMEFYFLRTQPETENGKRLRQAYIERNTRNRSNDELGKD